MGRVHGELCVKMLSKLGWRFLFCLIVAHVVTAQEEKNNVASPSNRQSRLFYVTTQSTTSTLTTVTYCFVTSTTALSTCGKRRRKRDLGEFIEQDLEINPQRVDEASQLMPSEPTEQGERQGRFALYWLTTTSTSTSTAFSTTSSVASLTCTPSGFALSLCGK